MQIADRVLGGDVRPEDAAPPDRWQSMREAEVMLEAARWGHRGAMTGPLNRTSMRISDGVKMALDRHGLSRTEQMRRDVIVVSVIEGMVMNGSGDTPVSEALEIAREIASARKR
jgi:hypothetical protein